MESSTVFVPKLVFKTHLGRSFFHVNQIVGIESCHNNYLIYALNETTPAQASTKAEKIIYQWSNVDFCRLEHTGQLQYQRPRKRLYVLVQGSAGNQRRHGIVERPGDEGCTLRVGVWI
jgi:hypothetical protein